MLVCHISIGRHLTPNAFLLLAGYNCIEKLYTFIPCDMAFVCPEDVEVQWIVEKSILLDFSFFFVLLTNESRNNKYYRH